MENKNKILGDINSTWSDIKCEKLAITDPDLPEKKYCSVASKAQGWNVETTPYYCSICLSQPNPKELGNKGIQIATIKASDKKDKELYFSAEERFGEGVGTELHKMIPKFLESPTCNCKSWAKKMNVWGPDTCEINKEYIVDKLVTEAKKRAIFSWVPSVATRTVAYKLVDTAIARARNKEKKDSWSVVVTTAPRRDPTLSACLESLLIAGWSAKIFAEPGEYNFISEEYRKNIIINKEKKGVWWNWIESARWALENTSAENIMTVQDDALFHPDSKSSVENFMWPCDDVGFISLYTPKHYSVMPRKKTIPRPVGLNRIITKALWGACALVWPRKVLERVINHDLIEGWLGAPLRTKSAWEETKQRRKEEPWRIQNSDTAIGKIMNEMKRSMWFMDPSPVQHVAQYSAVNHGGNKGRRNCGRCAKFSTPLDKQIPLHLNGAEDQRIVSYNEII